MSNKNQGHIEPGTKDGPCVYVREKADEETGEFTYYVGETGRGYSQRSRYMEGTNHTDHGGIVYAETASSDKLERRQRERELYDELVADGLTVYGKRH